MDIKKEYQKDAKEGYPGRISRKDIQGTRENKYERKDERKESKETLAFFLCGGRKNMSRAGWRGMPNSWE